jgi:hypothetical protein
LFELISKGHESQYAWPPQDPTRLTNPGPEYYNQSGSAFVYGNETFNPALKPTNSSLRSRDHQRHHHNQHQEGEVYSSGSERDNDNDNESISVSESSSPEPYLSDYDQDNYGPLASGERMPRYNRVREGSEGYEVRPMGSWNVVDLPPGPPDPREGGMGMGERREMPWEERGRYNVYEPAEEDEWDEEEEEGEDVPLAVLRNRLGGT